MHSIVGMLTDTLADVSGQSDDSVARLQAIEQQIERASGVDDVRTLTISLEGCLVALRDAVAQQRKASAATVDRLEDQIKTTRARLGPARTQSGFSRAETDLVPDHPEYMPDSTFTGYVAVFKLHRADHIATRFGESARHQLLSLVSQNLKSLVGPNDRLLRWKGTSFVMFFSSSKSLPEIRGTLAETVSRTGQHYIELGKKSVLLSVVVDWVVFEQAQYPSLDLVFTEVDSFLASEAPTSAGRPAVLGKTTMPKGA